MRVVLVETMESLSYELVDITVWGRKQGILLVTIKHMQKHPFDSEANSSHQMKMTQKTQSLSRIVVLYIRSFS